MEQPANTFFYTFKCECKRSSDAKKQICWPNDSKKIRLSTHAGREWQIVRYLLEREYKLHQVAQAKRNLQRSYFCAHLILDNGTIAPVVHDTQLVDINSRIILSRHPLPMNTMPFVPWRFQRRLLDLLPDNASDEQAKIAWLTNFSTAPVSFSDYLSTATTLAISNDHSSSSSSPFSSTDPTRWRSRRLLVPKGIPERQLRPARTPEELQSAYTDKHGNLVVVNPDCSRRDWRLAILKGTA